MATLNVGALAARLGLDPADFLEKMKGVQGFTTGAGERMAAEMKRTSREGSESLRLFDEALGVHLSRPLTRILTTEFPGLAKGLQSVLGGAVFSALGMAAFEFGEKLVRNIEKAQQAQEAFRAASANVGSTLEHITDSWTLKINALSGKHSLAAIISEGAGEARKQWEELSKAIDDAAKKRAEAQKPLTLLEAGAGDWFANLTQGSTAGVIHEHQQQAEQMGRAIQEAFRTDQLKGTHTALALIEADLAAVNTKLTEYQTLGAQAFSSQSMYELQVGNLERQIAALDQARQIEKAREAWEKATAAAKANEDALRRQREAVAAFGALYKDIGASLSKLQPETDPIKKLTFEITEMRMKAQNDFIEMERAGASALLMRPAHQALDAYLAKLDLLKKKLIADLEIAAAAEKLPTVIAGAPMPVLPAARTAMPTLGTGGTAAAQLEAFQKDQAAQLRLAAQAYQEAMSPQQKYQLGIEELSLLLEKGLVGQTAYSAGVAQLEQQMIKAADSVHRLQEEMMKLLERSDSASAGAAAWAKQVQINAAQTGKFVFDELTAASKGFEDTAAASLIRIIESHKNEHRKLMLELGRMWEGYFANLAQTAMKYGMDKLVGAALGKLGGGVLGKVFGGTNAGQGAAGATLQGAGTTLMTAGTALNAAAAALSAAAAAKAAIPTSLPLPIPGIGGGGAGAGAAAAGGAESPAFAGFFASGGDVSPGASFVAGEAGAEEITLGARGSAHVEPLGAKGGGDTTHYYDMRGAVVTEDLLHKAEAARMMSLSENRAVARSVSMQTDTARRSRPPR